MQNQKLPQEQIPEDILIIGGGPIGSLLAHIFATKYNYSVRVIERYPDLTDPSTQIEDRSGLVSLQYRSINIYNKYGLSKDVRKYLSPVSQMSFLVGDFQMTFPFLPGNPVSFHTFARKDMSAMLIEKNKQNPKISYEFNTKITNIDFQNKTFTSLNRSTKETLLRKFKFIIGSDGYNSQVREGIDKQLINERNLPKDTILTQVKQFPFSPKNIYMPNYPQYLNLQDEVKEGKYPLYNKLDEKFKKNYIKPQGHYLIDPQNLYATGAQNFLSFQVPYVDGTGNVILGMPKNEQQIDQFLEDYPQYKDNWRFNKDQVIYHDDIQSDEQIHEFLEKHIPIFYGLIPDMVEQWKKSPQYKSYTVYCDNWFYNSDACLFGDACEGMPYPSANGFNLSMENLDKFFQILDQKSEGDLQKFLNNSSFRSEIFTSYQENCFKTTRLCQEQDTLDAIFPSLSQAMHPKGQLMQAVEQKLSQDACGIYTNKINLCFFTSDSFDIAQNKTKIFQEYILNKIKDVEKFEDVNLTNCKQDLVDLLEKNNLPVYYNIEKSCCYA